MVKRLQRTTCMGNSTFVIKKDHKVKGTLAYVCVCDRFNIKPNTRQVDDSERKKVGDGRWSINQNENRKD